MFKPNSKINQKISQLFLHAHRPSETDLILQKAWFRNLKGNPPHKNSSSFGDAIIWETIIDQCADDDSILISGDGDFESEINCGEINELLGFEWSQKSKKKLTLYTELGSFINQQSKGKNKPIKKETIQEENRLNFVFANPAALSGQGELKSLTLNESVRINNDPLSVRFSTIWGTQNKCDCCGAEVDGSSLYGALGSSRCENCRDQFSSSLTCSKCGKHFHRNISTTLFNDNICDDCHKLLGLSHF